MVYLNKQRKLEGVKLESCHMSTHCVFFHDLLLSCSRPRSSVQLHTVVLGPRVWEPVGGEDRPQGWNLDLDPSRKSFWTCLVMVSQTITIKLLLCYCFGRNTGEQQCILGNAVSTNIKQQALGQTYGRGRLSAVSWVKSPWGNERNPRM